MRELHLFAGIGGGILGGMLLGHRCVGAVESLPIGWADLERSAMPRFQQWLRLHSEPSCASTTARR